MLPTCRHILTSGRKCESIALRRRNFCYHHDKLHIDRRSSDLRSQIRRQTYDHGTMLVPDSPEPYVDPNPPYPISLEFPEEPAAILTNIYRVTNMLVRGQIDRPTANSVTYGMQVCLSALNGKPLFEATPALASRSSSHNTDSDDSSDSLTSGPSTPVLRPVHRVILTPDGDEIAPPVEILEENEAEPIHHKGCACLECAEKYRNQPPEEHHPNCQCGLCEEQEQDEDESEHRMSCHPEGDVSETGVSDAPGVGALGWEASSEARDLQFAESGTTEGAPSLAQPRVGELNVSTTTLIPARCFLRPRRKRVARASALLSGSPSRDPLNRPWSVAEYTFGDAIRRHEAQYAARAAAALAVGIEPPSYEPFTTGLIPPGTPEYGEDQQMQQQSSEYWGAHFRRLIADRPDIQQYLDEEQDADSDADAGAPSSRS